MTPASKILRNTGNYNPAYRGELRQIDEHRANREEIIRLALCSYGHLIQIMTTFRLDYLGMLIYQAYDQQNPRNSLVANICLLNGDTYCPFQRLANGTFQQLLVEGSQ
ncbi:MAG: hypothetical protein EOO39_00060 [Cytophagaceae bacterium]|nr:MAG: hypothetical protein EOO39_00060 [Cytophagaceae bacterium]